MDYNGVLVTVGHTSFCNAVANTASLLVAGILIRATQYSGYEACGPV
jgi:hypothetical protein